MTSLPHLTLSISLLMYLKAPSSVNGLTDHSFHSPIFSCMKIRFSFSSLFLLTGFPSNQTGLGCNFFLTFFSLSPNQLFYLFSHKLFSYLNSFPSFSNVFRLFATLASSSHFLFLVSLHLYIATVA